MSGRRWYLPLKETKRVVEVCSQKRSAVIGIDFVHIRKGAVHPQVPINSADWASFLQAACWQDVVAQYATLRPSKSLSGKKEKIQSSSVPVYFLVQKNGQLATGLNLISLK